MPKQKITKEMIVEAGFDLVRQGGMERATVKAIAQQLNCSVQPVYSYCESMKGLRQEMTQRAAAFVREYTAARLRPADLFRSMGQAYLQLAGEEPEIFKLFILGQRQGVDSLKSLYRQETDPRLAEVIGNQLGISLAEARALHLHLLIYTIGLGTILSVTTPGVGLEEMLAQQEAAGEIFSQWAVKNRREEPQ